MPQKPVIISQAARGYWEQEWDFRLWVKPPGSYRMYPVLLARQEFKIWLRICLSLLPRKTLLGEKGSHGWQMCSGFLCGTELWFAAPALRITKSAKAFIISVLWVLLSNTLCGVRAFWCSYFCDYLSWAKHCLFLCYSSPLSLFLCFRMNFIQMRLESSPKIEGENKWLG